MSFNDVEEVTAGEEEEPSITEVTVEQPGSTVDMEGDEENRRRPFSKERQRRKADARARPGAR